VTRRVVLITLRNKIVDSHCTWEMWVYIYIFFSCVFLLVCISTGHPISSGPVQETFWYVYKEDWNNWLAGGLGQHWPIGPFMRSEECDVLKCINVMVPYMIITATGYTRIVLDNIIYLRCPYCRYDFSGAASSPIFRGLGVIMLTGLYYGCGLLQVLLRSWGMRGHVV
jgi:hypothetical protein